MVAIYVLKPYPLPGLAGTLEPKNPYAQIFSITNTGQLPMRDVRAGCIHNLILFDNGDLARTPSDVMLYSAPKRLAAGESFTIQVGQASRLFIANEHEKIMTTGPPSNPNAAYVRFVEVSPNKHEGTVVKKHEPLWFNPGQEILTNAIDAVIVLKYRLPLLPWEFTKSWRYTTQRNPDGTFVWRSRTSSEPPLEIPAGHHDELVLR